MPHPAAHRYDPDERHPTHEHDHDQLSLLLAGAVAEASGGREEVGRAFSVVFKPAGFPHRNRFGTDGALLLQFRFDPGALAPLLDPGRTLDAWQWHRTGDVARAFLRAADDDPPEAAVVDLLAILTRRAENHPAGTPPAWLARALDRIREEHGRTTAAELARDAGVHPVHLARCIRRWRGHSLSEEMRLARLARAADAVAREEGTISPIAHATGFSDHPHLCREFRRSTGLSPRRFRERVARLTFRHPFPGADVGIVQAGRGGPV